MNLFQREKTVVGLDIGSHGVKLVHLLHGEGVRRLLSAQEEEYTGTGEAGQDRIVKAIREVFRRAGLGSGGGADVVTSVDGAGTSIKQVEFPLLTDEELSSSIRWQAGKQLPFKPEEAVFDFQVLSRDEDLGKMSVLLAAVTKTHLAAHLDILGKVGIDPPIIDLSALAAANALLISQGIEEGQAIVLLDLGAAKTMLSVFSPGDLFFTRDISISGGRLTAEIQHSMDISAEEAERMKRDGEATELFAVLKNPLDRLLFEIRRSLTYYENRRSKGGFHKLYLSGGGARLQGLADHLHTSLGVPVEELNPLEGIEIGELREELKEMAPRLTLAVGLALREVGKRDV